MKYNKGTIVPRRLVRCRSRKTQHLWTFGADVDVTGREIKMLSDGAAIVCSHKGFVGGKHGKPKIINIAHIHGICIIGNGSNSTAFQI